MMRRLYPTILLFLIWGAIIGESAVFRRDQGLQFRPTVTASSGGTTTAVATSDQVQVFTGASNENFRLPDATTLANGHWYEVRGQSSGVITVVDNASTSLCTVNNNEIAHIVLQDNSASAGTWLCHVTIEEENIDHGSISGLGDDDHTQYFNTARGDARYHPRNDFINSFSGLGGEPVKTGSNGLIAANLLPVGTGGEIIREVQNSGVALTDRDILNFDEGITVTDTGSAFDVNLDISAITTEQESLATGDLLAVHVASANAGRFVDYDTLQSGILGNTVIAGQEDGAAVASRNTINAQEGIVLSDDGSVLDIDLDVSDLSVEQTAAPATGDLFAVHVATANTTRSMDYDTLQSGILGNLDLNSLDSQVLYNNGGVIGGTNFHIFDDATNKISIGDGGVNKTSLFVNGSTQTATSSNNAKVFIRNANNETALELAQGTGSFDSSGGTVGFQFITGSSLNVVRGYGSITAIEQYGTDLVRDSAIYARSDGNLVLLHGTSGFFAGSDQANGDLRVGSTINAAKGDILLGVNSGETVVLGDNSAVAAPLRFLERAAPSTPGANFGEVYLNSTSGELTIRKDDGSDVSLETGGSFDPATSAVWDAILGSAAEVLANKATHSTLSSALDATASGDSLLILPGTHTAGITLPHSMYIKCQGNATILDGTLTIDATNDHNWITGCKLTDNITIATGSRGNVINPVWFVDGKGVVNAGDASGNANYIVQFEE